MYFILSHWPLITLVMVAIIVIIGATLEIRSANRRERLLRNNWIRARTDLEKWLSDDQCRDINSPEGQYLLSLEIGAFMRYIAQKGVEERDRRYLQNKINLLSDQPGKVVFRNPYFQ